MGKPEPDVRRIVVSRELMVGVKYGVWCSRFDDDICEDVYGYVECEYLGRNKHNNHIFLDRARLVTLDIHPDALDVQSSDRYLEYVIGKKEIRIRTETVIDPIIDKSWLSWGYHDIISHMYEKATGKIIEEQ